MVFEVSAGKRSSLGAENPLNMDMLLTLSDAHTSNFVLCEMYLHITHQRQVNVYVPKSQEKKS